MRHENVRGPKQAGDDAGGYFDPTAIEPGTHGAGDPLNSFRLEEPYSHLLFTPPLAPEAIHKGDLVVIAGRNEPGNIAHIQIDRDENGKRIDQLFTVYFESTGQKVDVTFGQIRGLK